MLAFTRKLRTFILDTTYIMKKHYPRNIDGFGLRRRSIPRNAVKPTADMDTLPVPQQYLKETSPHKAPVIHRRMAATAVGEMQTTAANPNPSLAKEIHESLNSIDEEKPKSVKPKRSRRKLIKRFLLLVLAGLVLWFGFIGVKAFLASRSVFNGNLFEVFANKQLKKDQYGRSNILLFGTSEDDPGHEDSGAELTDSIMVVSVSQEKKDAVMFSIPRDLWVDYRRACSAGYSGKINALYSCVKEGSSEDAGAKALKGAIGEIFGLDIQYYAKVNYTALKDAVNAVGGITVTIDSDDPRGILDFNFDWQCGASWAQRRTKCPPNGHMVEYPNGPVDLDGDHALALARARNAAGGYGLGGGNFDREQYQQKIIVAIKEKAASAGTLANPVAVSGLIDSVGNNVKTNFETGEIKALVDLANDTDKTKIRSLSLNDKDAPLVTTANYSGQSIVRPVAGLEDFSDIKNFIQTRLHEAAGTNESATIEVLNGTDRSGVASRKEAELESAGIIVTSIGDAPTSESYGALQWFDLTGGTKPQTAKKLQHTLGEPSSGSQLPPGVESEANFVIIIGRE